MTNIKPTRSNSSYVPLFSPGQIVATPAALCAMKAHGVDPMDLLLRHVCGDWGNVHPDDAAANVPALTAGTRLLSSYALDTGAPNAGIRSAIVWIITGHNRELTTFLLPEDY
jgi:hypothetical protein